MHDRRYMNHIVLCNVALYKMEYLRKLTYKLTAVISALGN